MKLAASWRVETLRDAWTTETTLGACTHELAACVRAGRQVSFDEFRRAAATWARCQFVDLNHSITVHRHRIGCSRFRTLEAQKPQAACSWLFARGLCLVAPPGFPPKPASPSPARGQKTPRVRPAPHPGFSLGWMSLLRACPSLS